MLIHELAQQTGVPAKTIRYYEDIAILPTPARHENNYRRYSSADVERLRFVASARSLGFALEDLVTILATRDAGIAPCEHVLATLEMQLEDMDRRIVEMLVLRKTLRQLYHAGVTLPRDDVTLSVPHLVAGSCLSFPRPSRPQRFDFGATFCAAVHHGGICA